MKCCCPCKRRAWRCLRICCLMPSATSWIADARPALPAPKPWPPTAAPKPSTPTAPATACFTRAGKPRSWSSGSAHCAIAALACGEWRGLQVLNYHPGAHNTSHTTITSIRTKAALTRSCAVAGNVGTLVIYLNDSPSAAAPSFPKHSCAFTPQRARGVFWLSTPRCQHAAGDPVIAGEKWIATKWLRAREFR